MGFKSVMKKVGKVALKVAPIAAAFIPGVGPLASMAIGAATNAASKKAEGGSWKQALVSGGIGAAEGYGAGALKSAGAAAKAAKGVGPSATVVENAGKTASTASKLGKVMSNVNKGINIANPVMGAISATRGLGPSSSSSPSQGSSGGSGNAPGFQYGSNNPNLALSINSGRQAAAKDQGFRRGYDITAPNADDPTLPREVISSMPRIHTDYASMGLPSRNRRSTLGQDGNLKMNGPKRKTQPVSVSPNVY